MNDDLVSWRPATGWTWNLDACPWLWPQRPATLFGPSTPHPPCSFYDADRRPRTPAPSFDLRQVALFDMSFAEHALLLQSLGDNGAKPPAQPTVPTVSLPEGFHFNRYLNLTMRAAVGTFRLFAPPVVVEQPWKHEDQNLGPFPTGLPALQLER